MNEIYDCLIIGCGPCGIGAAIKLKEAGKKIAIIEGNMPGGKVNIAPRVDNYPGFKEIPGPQLAMEFFNRVNNNGIEVIYDQIDTLKKEFPHLDEKFIFDEFVRVSSSLYSKVVTSYPNCREVLLELKKHGIKLGVVTNKYHKPALLCLDVIHLEDVFDVVIGYDDVSICKPHGEGILKALKILKANDLKSALYVGDNKIDLDTANNAGIDCALVTWGPRKIDESLKPTFKVKDYLQLRRILLDE